MESLPLVLTAMRRWYTNKSTISDLLVGMDSISHTLEDPVREGKKVPGETAIPAGRYEFILSYSNRFKCYLPLLLNVPGFEGIRIHSGNRPENTEGCLLVGKVRPLDQPDLILESRTALKELMAILEPASKKGKMFIEIIDQRKEAIA